MAILSFASSSTGFCVCVRICCIKKMKPWGLARFFLLQRCARGIGGQYSRHCNSSCRAAGCLFFLCLCRAFFCPHMEGKGAKGYNGVLFVNSDCSLKSLVCLVRFSHNATCGKRGATSRVEMGEQSACVSIRVH